jgi:hypothetical protein
VTTTAAPARRRRTPTACMVCGGKSWNGHTCRGCRRAMPATSAEGKRPSRDDVQREIECRRGFHALDEYIRQHQLDRFTPHEAIILAIGGEIELKPDSRTLALQRWAWTGDASLAAAMGLVGRPDPAGRPQSDAA